MALVKTGLTTAALGVTAYSRVLGKRVSATTHVPAASGTQPTAATPAEATAAQRQLALPQWAVPAPTGALLVVSSFAGEQERASEVRKGVVRRVIA